MSNISDTKENRKKEYTEHNTYLRVASALSTVTLSSVASRWGRPKSKYFMSKSKNGKISWKNPIKNGLDEFNHENEITQKKKKPK